MKISVPPSLDSAAAIQEAADKLARDTPRYDIGRVVLEGVYYLRRPVVFQPANDRSVVLDAREHAYCEYVGERTDEYLFRFAGANDRGNYPIIQGLFLNGMRKCRGIAIDGHQHKALFQDCYVWQMRQVGVRVSNCWGSVITDTAIMSCVGVGLWTTAYNTSRLDRLRLQILGCHHTSWGSDANAELWHYTVRHGRAAAKAYYGEQFVEDWPTELQADQRACLVWQGGNMQAASLTFEHSRPCEYPLVYTSNRYGAIDGMRVESTSCRNSRVVWHGSGKARDGAFAVSHVDGAVDEPAGSCRTFLELRGQTSGARVADSYLHGLMSVIDASHGVHAGMTVGGLTTIGKALTPEQCITAPPLLAGVD